MAQRSPEHDPNWNTSRWRHELTPESGMTGRSGLGTRVDVMGLSKTLLAVCAVALLLSGCSAYGGETVGAEDGSDGRIQSDREYCAMTLPEGWTWRPASWAAISPLGTELAFADYLYGRPMYPEWEEAKQTTIEQILRRTPDVTIIDEDDRLVIDYGEDGGYAWLQRFDRVGCHLTFSREAGAREQEFEVWQAIIASLERTSPDPNFTPSP